MSGVISPLIRHISIATLIITPFRTTHEPPSKSRVWASELRVAQSSGASRAEFGPTMEALARKKQTTGFRV